MLREKMEPVERKKIRRHKPINRKTKLNIVFDEKARRYKHKLCYFLLLCSVNSKQFHHQTINHF